MKTKIVLLGLAVCVLILFWLDTFQNAILETQADQIQEIRIQMIRAEGDQKFLEQEIESLKEKKISGLKTSVQKKTISKDCEQYRGIIKNYFGDQTDNALFVASKESNCNQLAVSKTNDHCIFQIHNEPETGKDINLCVKRAFDKYQSGRIGANNFSAWYSVCGVGNNPRQKFEGVKCI